MCPGALSSLPAILLYLCTPDLLASLPFLPWKYSVWAISVRLYLRLSLLAGSSPRSLHSWLFVFKFNLFFGNHYTQYEAQTPRSSAGCFCDWVSQASLHSWHFFFFNHLEFIKMSPSPLGLSLILHPHPTLHFSRIVPLNWLYLIYLVHLLLLLFISVSASRRQISWEQTFICLAFHCILGA